MTVHTPRSEPLAKPRRPMRRSMAELTASLAKGAVVEKLPLAQSVASARHSPATALDKAGDEKAPRTSKRLINAQPSQAQDAALSRLPPDRGLNRELDNDGLSRQLDDIASAAAKAARNYRSWMLQNMKVSINAALDYADGLTRASLSPGVGGKAADQPRQPEKASSTPKREPQLPAHIKVAEAYRAKAFELMTANVNATLEYAQQLVNVRSLPECIELSTTHARKHLQLIMTQTAALGALSQSLTAGNVERVTAIAKALSQKTA